MPIFSVIIPLYNKEKYIKKTVESVLNQSFTNFEIIIVDDGSKDTSLQIVQQFTDDRINLVSQTNSGVSAARNKGASIAKAEYIAFLDSDDWWDTHFLQTMYELITEDRREAVYSSRYYTVKNQTLKPSQNGKPDNFKGQLDYFEAYTDSWWMPITSSNVVFSKKLFDSVNGFDTNLKFGEDLHLWLRLVLKYPLIYSNKLLAFYNQDVDVKDRALGNKMWKKEEHVIFNLNFLENEINQNHKLKYLIDGLKLRSLLPYYRKKLYKEDVIKLLNSVDFNAHDKSYTFYYKYPFWITETFYNFKLLGSRIKQFIKSITY